MADRDRQVFQADDMHRASTVMIKIGVETVKKNPLKVGAYIVGILICLLFNGWKIDDSQRNAYQQRIDSFDYVKLQEAGIILDRATNDYQDSRGFFFSCDAICSMKKEEMEEAKLRYNTLAAEEERNRSEGKSQLGLFSEVGVAETRELFWLRFAQGKGFATRQTKWDALFMGIGAMGRDESIVSYLFRLLMSMAFNFTIGVIGAAVTFLFNLVSVIRSYQASIIVGFTFFALSALAMIAFLATWLIGFYLATAGAVYVGAKVLATNLRIQNNSDHRRVR
eukprot:CAMPEP_0170062676 /NCGR_PEP_ID=MMETSP0019_2-20121128/3814_1 /TAXON_ID=98059 /ORGANISM="Dinobryon sp., Strain UTEXLB2267" /LENGTH=279 /DNA_ID=CAMNT_0010268885 /DNA_START=46 /DNA_END=885 /DNA_ORIENTATION=+